MAIERGRWDNEDSVRLKAEKLMTYSSQGNNMFFEQALRSPSYQVFARLLDYSTRMYDTRTHSRLESGRS